MLTKDIGNIGELITAAHFIKMGCNVFTSLADNSEIDYIVEYNGSLKRIQVKTTENVKDGKMEWRLSRSRMNYQGARREFYSSQNIDFFVLYCIENSYIGVIPAEGANSTVIYLRIEPCKNGQLKGVRFAKDYELNNLSCIGVVG